MAAIIIFFVLHWYLSLFSQTFFLHRYAAHRAFTMCKGWEKFFFFFTWLTQGSSYLSARGYGIMHRVHHAYTDTDKDPHSPAFDKNIMSMMLRTKNIYAAIVNDTYPVEERFKKNVPEWKWFDKFASGYISRLAWVGAYIWFYVTFAPSLWFLPLVLVHAVMGPLHGVIINWYAHKYGHVNYETDNTSKNLFKIDWLMMGEGYHNNHHVHPSRPNFASAKGEFDPTYPVIKMLEKLSIIKVVKQPVQGTVKTISQPEPEREYAS